MGGHEASGAALEQTADDRLGSDASVMRVGAVQDLVEQKEHGRRAAGPIDDLLEAKQLGVEAGSALLEGVVDAERGAEPEGRDEEAPGTDGRAREREHGVDADRSQERAL